MMKAEKKAKMEILEKQKLERQKLEIKNMRKIEKLNNNRKSRVEWVIRKLTGLITEFLEYLYTLESEVLDLYFK